MKKKILKRIERQLVGIDRMVRVLFLENHLSDDDVLKVIYYDNGNPMLDTSTTAKPLPDPEIKIT